MEWINKSDRPTKAGFGEGIRDAAQKNKNVVGLGSDITSSVSMNLFAKAFPERFFSLGIAEQNAVGVAAGLALSGKIPVFSTYGVFAAMRALDQIRISICYNNVHAVIGGAHAGISVGPDGATHQALEDLAVMRVLPNMKVLSPCDATQAKLAAMAAIEQCNGPVYIRFGREAVPDFTNEAQDFQIGKAQMMRDGLDLSIIASGHMVWEAIQAAKILDQNGVSAQVVNMHTIKPLDEASVIAAAQKTGRVLTAEEHQVAGGLGGAVAEVLAQHYPVKMAFVGMKDSFGESGKPEELMEKYQLTAAWIAKAAESLL